MRIANLLAVGVSVREAHGVGGTVNAAVAAAGSSKTDATLLTADINLVTTCTAGQGVILPTGTFGDEIWVGNGTTGSGTESVFVYPPSGGKLNGQTADIPLTLAPTMAVKFKALTSVNYLVA